MNLAGTNKGNLIIAEYMGGELFKGLHNGNIYNDTFVIEIDCVRHLLVNVGYHQSEYRTFEASQLKYHQKWDWLFPVTEKLMGDNELKLDAERVNWYIEKLREAILSFNLDDVWCIVVDMLKENKDQCQKN